MKNLTVLAICVVFCSLVLESQTIKPSFSDVDYVGKGNNKQMLDIYIPTGVTVRSPAIVHIHGGAFMMGSKSTTDQSSYQYFYNNGMVCVDINYRLSADSIWPAQVYDCKAAIRFLKANADKYLIDTNKIGVIGESAGGYLVAMLGTTADVNSLEGTHLGNSHVSSRVQAVVDLFGPINFLTMDSEATALGFKINTNSATSPESKLMGAAVQTIPELVARANPTTYITEDDASFFISAGSADKNIPYTQGQHFNTALAKVIGTERSFFELINGAGHGGSSWHSAEQDAKYLAFFIKSFSFVNSVDSNHGNMDDCTAKIYPNPATNSLFIQDQTENISKYDIVNIYGKTVQSGMVNDGMIDISHLPVGIYFIQIGNYTEKFVVVR